MNAYLVSVKTAQGTLDLASSLLNEGVLPEDISVIVDEMFSERLAGSSERSAVPTMAMDLLTEPEEDADFDYASTGNPEMKRSSDNALSPHRPIYESEVGAGISTASPGDSVSSIDEMDDSQSVAEEMMEPLGTLDIRDQGPETPSLDDIPGSRSRLSSPTGIHGLELGVGVGLLAALIPAVVPGVGVVMGDGPLASDLLAEQGRAIDEGVAPFLRAQGLEEADATRFEDALASGGGILEVAAASGEASGRQIVGILESHDHGRYKVVSVD